MRGDGLADGPKFGRTSGVGVGTGVSLGESRCATVGQGVDTGRVRSIGVTACEPGLRIVSRHDPFTAHFVERVLAHLRSRIGGVLGRADSKAELGVGHVVHPFLVVDVGSRDVGGDVASNGISISGRAVGVQFASCKAQESARIL